MKLDFETIVDHGADEPEPIHPLRLSRIVGQKPDQPFLTNTLEALDLRFDWIDIIRHPFNDEPALSLFLNQCSELQTLSLTNCWQPIFSSLPTPLRTLSLLAPDSGSCEEVVESLSAREHSLSALEAVEIVLPDIEEEEFEEDDLDSCRDALREAIRARGIRCESKVLRESITSPLGAARSPIPSFVAVAECSQQDEWDHTAGGSWSWDD